MTKNADNRARAFNVQRSFKYDTHEKNDSGELVKRKDAATPEEWREMIQREWIAYAEDNGAGIAMIFHDKDAEDGLHAHAVIMWPSSSPARRQPAVMKALGASSPQNCQKTADKPASLRYLLHITDDAIRDGKFIYSQDELITSGIDYIKEIQGTGSSRKGKKKLKEDIADFIAMMHYEVMEEGLTTSEAKEALFSEFGKTEPEVVRSFVRARKEFDTGMLYYDEKRKNEILEKGSRTLLTGYVQGAGGTGKTTLARAMANQVKDGRGLHIPAQESKQKTFDFVSTYRGEKVSVFDEISPGSFEFREFNGIFDPNHYSPTNSRNQDKHYLAEHAIFTNSMEWSHWRDDLLRYSKGGSYKFNMITGEPYDDPRVKDDLWQISRRFSYYIEMETMDNGEVDAHVYALDSSLRGFYYVGTATAPAQFWHGGADDFATEVWTLVRHGLEGPALIGDPKQHRIQLDDWDSYKRDNLVDDPSLNMGQISVINEEDNPFIK